MISKWTFQKKAFYIIKKRLEKLGYKNKNISDINIFKKILISFKELIHRLRVYREKVRNRLYFK